MSWLQWVGRCLMMHSCLVWGGPGAGGGEGG